MLFVIGFMMSSCEKTTYVNNIEWHVEDFFVDRWDYSNLPSTQYNNNYYYADFKWPSLSKFVYTDGSLQAYIVMTKNGTEVQMPLPYVEHCEEQLEDKSWMYYTKTYNVEYSVEGIRFTYQTSLFQYEDIAYELKYGPSAHKFRVVLQW